MKLKGIGKRIAEKIDQILTTGILPQLEMDPQSKAVDHFASIWGKWVRMLESFPCRGRASDGQKVVR